MFTIYQKMLQAREPSYQFEIAHRYWTAVARYESKAEAAQTRAEAIAEGLKVSEISLKCH